MAGLIDIHQHIVYGVDDGPRTPEEAEAMLAANRREGITDVIATSHALPAMQPFPTERYLRHLRWMNQLGAERRFGVRLYPGCEVFYSDIAVRHLLERRLPTLAGSRFTLIEFDPTSTFDAIDGAVRRLANAGLIPIIAHCERYGAMVNRPKETIAMRREYRMRLQVNAETVTTKTPRPIRKFCGALMETGALDYIATDAHNDASRPPKLRGAYDALRKLYGEDSAARWVCEGQTEIFDPEYRLI